MRYEPDHGLKGIGGLLVSDDMGDAMRTVAQAGMALAISNSPVESGEYKASFDIDVEVQGDRKTAILANTSDHAFAVELRDHVLGRTVDWIERA